jgi:hypothetical protein
MLELALLVLVLKINLEPNLIFGIGLKIRTNYFWEKCT